MPTPADTTLARLNIVAAERARRATVPGLNAKVLALKAYQQRRFAHTYADLLRSTRYGPASRFFLDELYGPSDFTRRDAQFARVVPALVRLFPSEIVDTVATLSELHALSETLDTRMGEQLHSETIKSIDYVEAWQATGLPDHRQSQIALTLDVAKRLDRFTRRIVLRNSLRLMRGPARAAGLGDLQQFLEAGFETFRAMGGATEFISMVSMREQTLARSLFEAKLGGIDNPTMVRALANLP